MSEKFIIDFETIKTGEGVIDFALRYDSNSGWYEYVIEEAGIPTQMKKYEIVGILQIIIQEIINDER